MHFAANFLPDDQQNSKKAALQKECNMFVAASAFANISSTKSE